MKVPPIWTALSTTDNKSWSFARVTSAALIAAAIFWVTFLVINTKKIPDNLPGLATLLLSIYGINRGAEAYENKPSAPVQTIQPSEPTQNVEIHT